MKRTLTGRGVLLILFAFFGVIFATNAIFITAAIRTFRGEDEALPYLQGVQYNQVLARRAQQARAGWRASIGEERLSSGMVLLSIDVRRPDGGLPGGLVLAGELRHPADEHRDRTLQLSETRPGHFEALVRDLPAGRWQVMVSNQRQQPFQASRTLWVR